MRAAFGYPISAGAASLALVTAFEADSHPIANFSVDMITVYLQFWLIALVLTGVTTFVPFLIAWHVARKRKINSLAYFVACAGITSVLLCAVAAWAAGADIPPNDPDRLGFSAAFARFILAFIAGGLVGGITFWWCSCEAVVVRR